MVAVLLCEEMSRLLKPQFVGMEERWNADAEEMERIPSFVTRHISGNDLNALSKLMTNLLVTEVDRRRAHIELELGGDNGEVEEGDVEAELFELIQGGKAG
jgi:hypothetical protein